MSGNLATLEHELARTTDIKGRARLREKIDAEREKLDAAAAAELVADEAAAADKERARETRLAAAREERKTKLAAHQRTAREYLEAYGRLVQATRAMRRNRNALHVLDGEIARLRGNTESREPGPSDGALESARDRIDRAGIVTTYGLYNPAQSYAPNEDELIDAEVARQVRALLGPG